MQWSVKSFLLWTQKRFLHRNKKANLFEWRTTLHFISMSMIIFQKFQFQSIYYYIIKSNSNVFYTQHITIILWWKMSFFLCVSSSNGSDEWFAYRVDKVDSISLFHSFIQSFALDSLPFIIANYVKLCENQVTKQKIKNNHNGNMTRHLNENEQRTKQKSRKRLIDISHQAHVHICSKLYSYLWCNYFR